MQEVAGCLELGEATREASVGRDQGHPGDDGRREGGTEKSRDLYHHSGVLLGTLQPCWGWKVARMWQRPGPGCTTQEHPRGNYPWPVHLSLDLRGSLTEECHAGLLSTSSSPSAASFHMPPVAGRITAPKDVHALIPWDL